jgi:deoxyribodipyrimidine photo-lyase
MISSSLANRAQGLARLNEFLPRAGKAYRQSHLFDEGRDGHANVSRLSTYLRYRLISESEVAEAVLARHSASEAETFLNELLWRTYSKGWLEARAGVYMAYRRAVGDDLRRFHGTGPYRAAVEGRTGIAPFDAWNQELLQTGYLHNQARMAFASIWIFTLRLPWTLCAEHFQRNLLDADPASNTLGWRLVAGLQVPGKHVLAKAAEIEKISQGRFFPKGQLNEAAAPLTGPALPPARLLQLPQSPSALLGDRYALWVTPDDLTPELTPIGTLKPQKVYLSGLDGLDRSYVFSDGVQAFLRGALEDAQERLAAAYGCPVRPLPAGPDAGAALGAELVAESIPHLVYYQPQVGPWAELAASLTARDVGLRYFPLRRSWDAHLYPHAGRGYFQFQKAALPLVVRNRGKL